MPYHLILSFAAMRKSVQSIKYSLMYFEILIQMAGDWF